MRPDRESFMEVYQSREYELMVTMVVGGNHNLPNMPAGYHILAEVLLE